MNPVYDNEGLRVQSAPGCHLCQTPGELLYANLRDRLFGVRGVWNILRCPLCGLVWLDPRPSAEEIGQLYAEYHTHTATDGALHTLSRLRKGAERAILGTAYAYRGLATDGLARVTGRVLSWVGPLREEAGATVMWLDGSLRGRLLDVGCGSGQFLAQMQQLGWEVMGVEPDPVAAGVAHRMFHLNVASGTLEGARLPESSFDVVTMNHVIEHVPDPIGSLRECNRVLREGGRLIVVTPNVDSLGHRFFNRSWRGLEVPRHLQLFTLQALGACAERAGLRASELRTTARGARFFWHASQILRRDGVLPVGSPERPPLKLRIEGFLFWVVEHLMARVRPMGEEIVLVAGKGQAS